MTTPEAGTLATRPAANKRSPNRKPRTNSVIRANDFASRKKTVLACLRAGDTRMIASEKAGLLYHTLEKYMSQVPAYKAEVETAEAEGVALTQGVMEGVKPAVAKRVVDIVLTTRKEALAVDGGIRLMRGWGVLGGDGVNVAVGAKVEVVIHIDGPRPESES